MKPEYLVGYRYRMEDARSASRESIVLEKNGGHSKDGYHALVELPEPIAGPIARLWNGDFLKTYHALCEGCGETSKPYRRKNEPALWRWAHGHRCSPGTRKKEE